MSKHMFRHLHLPRPQGWSDSDEEDYAVARSDYRSIACMAGLLTTREREEKQAAYNMMREKEAKLYRLCAKEEQS